MRLNSLPLSRAWFEQTILHLVVENPLNRLVDFGGMPLFNNPIVGVADGDDPLFTELLTAVSPRHLMPRGFLRRRVPRDADVSHVTVVSWALPFTQEIRASNWSGQWPSRLYSIARNNGGTLIHEVSHQLTEILDRHGKVGVSPSLTEEYDAFRSPQYTFASSWSERHVAYVTGLGRFGLNGSLITAVGANVRLGSIVTNLPLEPTPRRGGGHMATCLKYEGENCNRCIERCPVGAVSRQGLDKERCYKRKRTIEKRFMKDYKSTMKMFPHLIVKSGKSTNGYSLGCALCQCDVPCEAGYPEWLLRKQNPHA